MGVLAEQDGYALSHIEPSGDLIVHLAIGRFLAIEVKRPGGKLTLDQTAFLEAVRQNGGIAIVATSVDDVMEGLGL
jgi:hypothetical protein